MTTVNTTNNFTTTTEKVINPIKGMPVLIINIALVLLSIYVFVISTMAVASSPNFINIFLIVISSIYFCVIQFFIYAGLKTIKPNEAIVLTLFGAYYGTIKSDGFYFVNPFCASVNPLKKLTETATTNAYSYPKPNAKVSLKVLTLNNEKQKVNDLLGNPIIIGTAVIWRVVDTAKAVFNVDNYEEFLSIQSDSAIRNIVRMYPYDTGLDDNEKTLRGSSQEIAQKLKEEIQEKVLVAGIEVLEARITHLSYAPEIAAVMLQRQQASAIIDARQMIVEGAVGMVEMALDKLNQNQVVNLDEERKAAMVSNLLVVLCGNKDAQPIVNSGSIY